MMHTSDGTDASLRRRATKACQNCRKRKIRCKPLDHTGNGPCERCLKLKLICTTRTIEGRGGYQNVLAGREQRQKKKSPTMRLHSHTIETNILDRELFTTNDAVEMLSWDGGGDELSNSEGKDQLTLALLEDRKQATIVSEGIITSQEFAQLVRRFFKKFAPFYAPSFIPAEFRDLRRLAVEPALAAVLCVISSRFHQDEDMQRRLLVYCRQTLSTYIWDCPAVHVRSLVYAVVILTEWGFAELLLGRSAENKGLKRYTKILWPLLGHAIRLSRHERLFESDIQAFIALHFEDQLLACWLGQEPMMNQAMETEALPEFSTQASLEQRANLDVIKLLHLANSSLYISRADFRQQVQTGKHLRIFRSLLPLIDKWNVDYSSIAYGSKWSDRAIMFEFHYCELYIFNLALLAFSDVAAPTESLSESREYLNIAIRAAQFIAKHANSPGCSLDIRCVPVHWIVRLLHATVFLAKTSLVASVELSPNTRDTLRKVIRESTDTLSRAERYAFFCHRLYAICDYLEGQTSLFHDNDSDTSPPQLNASSLVSPRAELDEELWGFLEDADIHSGLGIPLNLYGSS